MSARISNGPGRFHCFWPAAALAALLALQAGCVTEGSRGTEEARKHNTRGAEHLRRESWADAKTEFELALKIDPLYTVAKGNLGYAEHKLGHTEQAIKIVKDAIATDENESGSYYNLGEIYYDLKRYDDAEKQLKRAIELLETFKEAWFKLGEVYEAKKQRDKALESYDQASRIDPKYVEAHVSCGRLYLLNGVDDDARKHFLLALEYDKTSPLARQGLALIALKKDDFEAAIDELKLGLKGAPGHPILRRALQDVYAKARAYPRVAKSLLETARKEYEAAVALRGGKERADGLAEALEDTEAAGAIDPKLVGVPVLKSEILVNLDPPAIKEALKVMTAAMGRSEWRANHDVRFTFAVVNMIAFKAGDGTRVKIAEETLLKLVREIARNDPNRAKYHQYLGRCYMDQRLGRKAEREWFEALRTVEDPEARKEIEASLKQFWSSPVIRDANDLDKKAMGLAREKRYDEAIATLRQAIQQDKEFALARAHMAEISVEKGDLPFARTVAKEAIQLDAGLSYAHRVLGVINLKERKLVEARQELDLAKLLAPNDPEPWYWTGVLHAKQKQWKEAESAFAIVNDIDPKHYRMHYELALIAVAKGLDQAAETELQLALREDGGGKDYVPARVELGRLLLRQKRYTEALEAVEAAYALDPTAPEPWMGRAEAKIALGEKAEALGSYLNAAESYLGKNKYDEAVAAAEKAVALDKDSAAAKSVLGVCLINTGRYSDALRELKRADDLEPGNLLHRLRMGLCYERQGDKKRAADAYREIVNANPPNVVVAMECLAGLYDESARDNPLSKREAVDLLKRALRMRQTSPPDQRDADRERAVQGRLKELEK